MFCTDNHVFDTSVGFCMRYKIRACVYMYMIHGDKHLAHSFNFKIGFKIEPKIEPKN